MTQDVLQLTTMDASGGTKAGDWSPQPYERAEMWAAAVRCVDVDIMCSEVGWGRGSECSSSSGEVDYLRDDAIEWRPRAGAFSISLMAVAA
eukprot:CAMPEP_0185808654 /NCGR_PEP_ID=MMETSP1322-20130828/5736_1 /TAXON_ID=265543 /ORGANISM="Minutocellus polymorphus, Strain RCC2270" /LENGTH=90 /DNA_ID=CAMNT_0028504883 /DNA_START=565 /DNA_END=837 /DNA_ORIENTATION=-